MSDEVITGLLIGGIALVLIIAVVASVMMEKKRTQAFAQLAAALGLQFLPKDTGELEKRHGSLPLFNRGRRRSATNYIHGEYGGVQIGVFDYRYTTGSGKQSHTWNQTLVSVQSPSLSLPEFTLSPEGFFAKLGSIFGYQDIDFDSHPQFSKAYLLRGPNEGAIRDLFKPALLDYFEQRSGITVEGFGDLFVYYRASRRAKPPEIKDLITEGLATFKELAAAGQQAV